MLATEVSMDINDDLLPKASIPASVTFSQRCRFRSVNSRHLNLKNRNVIFPLLLQQCSIASTFL